MEIVDTYSAPSCTEHGGQTKSSNSKKFMNNQNRRWFLKRIAGAALAMGFVHTPRLPVGQGANTPKHFRPIRLGGPIFVKTDDPEELALAHRKLGYRAAYCPKISLDDSARIRAVADAFARHDIVIAEVGRWVNLLDADPGK